MPADTKRETATDTGAPGWLPPDHQGAVHAFALGGLGGSNAHGMGFLHAVAGNPDWKPQIISCTSGMIYWVWRWLKKAKLDEEFRTSQDKLPFSGDWAPFNLGWLALAGYPGKFRPCWPENIYKLFSFPPPLSADEILDRWLPARQMQPLMSEAEAEEIADGLNDTEVAILFNSFDPSSGIEYLHANPVARLMLKSIEQKRAGRTPQQKRPQALQDTLPKVETRDIDAQAVRDALWLSFYGFEPPTGSGGSRRVDGAYMRQFILDELVEADQIYVVRPQAFRFLGELPSNWFEGQDLQTELWFNSSYLRQVTTMDLLNRLQENGILASGYFKQVQLIPLEIEVQRGYFKYFQEDKQVFDAACTQAKKTLADYWR